MFEINDDPELKVLVLSEDEAYRGGVSIAYDCDIVIMKYRNGDAKIIKNRYGPIFVDFINMRCT